jgi:TRAP-type C4-dicarboxylate transport system permease small subunit
MNKTLLSLKFIDQKFEEIICYFAISAIAICVFLQAIVRIVFGTALAWPEEIAIYGMAWFVYMGASLSVRERAHLRIMIGVVKLPKPAAMTLIILGDCMWVAFNIFMVWHGYKYIELLWNQLYISPALQIDQKWPQAIVPLGFALMTVRIFQVYYSWIKKGAKDLPI